MITVLLLGNKVRQQKFSIQTRLHFNYKSLYFAKVNKDAGVGLLNLLYFAHVQLTCAKIDFTVEIQNCITYFAINPSFYDSLGVIVHLSTYSLVQNEIKQHIEIFY